MAIIRCENGHFYDDRKNDQCPYCSKNHNFSEKKTIWKRMEKNAEEKEAFQLESPVVLQADSDLTVGLISPGLGNDYVVGWVVCVKGPDRGRDYRLHHGFNRIGRGSMNDVSLENDPLICGTVHCSIVYEDRKNCFYLIPEEGQLTYYKNGLLENPQLLSNFDTFEMGESVIQFVALCGEDRKWKV